MIQLFGDKYFYSSNPRFLLSNSGEEEYPNDYKSPMVINETCPKDR